ncbi:methylenetetrahydrofolate reductase [NAD(P)H] [Salipiger sp. IMCC34102]|uniref:methylenetetrahydrofolate reductase [NAD(P)H] n=1 Tax=Salipiger sp. IMCC34102 TaxID=2510647 RepID=UPI00101BEB9C|nr:methylenetetrahydrofolate reductase [NAD(P)H] [Salipiger sp. IMCC34102]RYH02245.1 methylenetetrahydrofolate reductase [NAD(P)H] [Salipiger sp. IMCC34102]
MTRPALSFEFFPPKSLAGSFRLWDSVHALAPLGPEFVSVTYGAGGTTRQLTHEAVTTIDKTTGLKVAAHLTCVDASRAETLEIADSYARAGITDIVALRGDAPKGDAAFTPHTDGFANSVELIEALAETGNFTLRVGAYPEKHPEAADADADVAYLKRKIDAGAAAAITQFFFEADTFFRFRDRCVAAGIDAPIIPGVLPVENWKGASKFAKATGTSIPAEISQGFENAQTEADHDLLATALASELCDDLLRGGVEHLHFYTLNKPDLTQNVCRALGIAPRPRLQEVA